jgi:hypothetical protein
MMCGLLLKRSCILISCSTISRITGFRPYYFITFSAHFRPHYSRTMNTCPTPPSPISPQISYRTPSIYIDSYSIVIMRNFSGRLVRSEGNRVEVVGYRYYV